MTNARDMSPDEYAEARRTRAWRKADADAPPRKPALTMNEAIYRTSRLARAWRVPQRKGDD